MDDKEIKPVSRGSSTEFDDTQPSDQIPPIPHDMREESPISKVHGSTLFPLSEEHTDNLHLRIHIQRAHMLLLAHRDRKIA